MMMKEIMEAAEYIKAQGISGADIGVILGSGLSSLADEIEVQKVIDYATIPHFPIATVEFHNGKLICGKIGDKNVLVMQGRFHYYEGYNMKQITFPVRVMKVLGIKYLLLSNAAGGINLDYKKGDLVLIDDHINLQPENPLTGTNIDELGGRFPDMSQPYSKFLNAQIAEIAKTLSIPISQGVYAAVSGPNLETRAEYKYLKIIGADLVGMSTVPEVIVANHMGLPCAAISVVTDECDPENLHPVNIAEIIAVAGKADKKLTQVFVKLIKQLR